MRFIQIGGSLFIHSMARVIRLCLRFLFRVVAAQNAFYDFMICNLLLYLRAHHSELVACECPTSVFLHLSLLFLYEK